MRRWALWVALAACAFGAAVAGISTSQHMRISREGLERGSYCAISETINCDTVNASSYAEFLGVPIAWWGVCFYAAIAAFALYAALSKKERRASVAAAWFMACGGILYSIFLAYIAFVVLAVLCIECTAMYLANMLLFVFLFVAMGVPLGGAPRFVRDYALAVFGRRSNLGFKPAIFKQAAAAGIFFLIGWAAISQIQAKDRSAGGAASLEDKVRAFYMQSLSDIEIDTRWSVWGDPGAKVTIVEFSEFECPFCRLSAFNVKPALQEFRKDIRYYFVHYPLDSSCNDELDRPMHRHACFAARAAVCADRLGDFWGYHDDLFREQAQLTEGKIIAAAKGRGYDMEKFLECVGSPEVDEFVKSQIKAAQRIYVEGTPALYLNGRKLRHWHDRRYLQALVKEEIKRSSKGKGQGSE
ncbi:MAG: thioredoxin domain-containing protein [Proteobacteria bacterium]|nr:thioredoxin domain-containing protein [Pseudomonadota bacterium]